MSKEAEVVQKHITECELAIQNNDSDEISQVGTKIVNLYNTKIIAIVRWRVFPGGRDKLEFLLENLRLYKGELLDSIKKEELKQQKISLNASVEGSGNSNSTNNNTNTNTNTVDVKTLFENAKKEIEDNGSLTGEEIEEIIEKINEIEGISEEEISRPKKWGKLKSVINWMTTKGVDIGTKIYPLIMASLENNN